MSKDRFLAGNCTDRLGPHKGGQHHRAHDHTVGNQLTAANHGMARGRLLSGERGLGNRGRWRPRRGWCQATAAT